MKKPVNVDPDQAIGAMHNLILVMVRMKAETRELVITEAKDQVRRKTESARCFPSFGFGIDYAEQVAFWSALERCLAAYAYEVKP